MYLLHTLLDSLYHTLVTSPPSSIQSIVYTSISLSTPMATCGDNFTFEDQVQVLSKQLAKERSKIKVCFPTGGNKPLAENVASHLRVLLFGECVSINVIEMKEDRQCWLIPIREESATYYVFIGLPPSSAQNPSAEMEEFFNPYADEGWQVSRVLFMDPQTTTFLPSLRPYFPKNLNGFLHLDGKLHPDELARRVLGHFGGKG